MFFVIYYYIFFTNIFFTMFTKQKKNRLKQFVSGPVTQKKTFDYQVVHHLDTVNVLSRTYFIWDTFKIHPRSKSTKSKSTRSKSTQFKIHPIEINPSRRKHLALSISFKKNYHLNKSHKTTKLIS